MLFIDKIFGSCSGHIKCWVHCTAHTVAEVGPCTRSVCRLQPSCTLTSCVLPQHTSGQAPQHTAIFFVKDTSSCAQPCAQPPGCQDHQKPCPSRVMTSSETHWKNCTEIPVHCWQTTTSCEFKDKALFADRSELAVAGCCECYSEGWEYLSWLSA